MVQKALGIRTSVARDPAWPGLIGVSPAPGEAVSLEIRDLVGTMDSGGQPCGHVSQFIDRKIEEMDRTIQEFTRFRDELRAYKTRMDAAEPAAPVPCRHSQGVQNGPWDASPQAPEESLASRCASERNVGPLTLVKPGR